LAHLGPELNGMIPGFPVYSSGGQTRPRPKPLYVVTPSPFMLPYRTRRGFFFENWRTSPYSWPYPTHEGASWP